ncbi:AAA-like domain-containing protein [cf. Phormidesmis sp. LEGE 11477]|uniref:AAA-like domain-containing protein n=1 Tax=cf. Phormidesmis sp. LEGE 11477 TaxID=1828680 RepID=UPI001882097C|nr:AAA-like domain-containing protein [cf. Phormidesmis sp. LEGE 11477]MBE9060029.1 AAA-like domain-containing protein [cf. Phormidesmis sp. LEGE 11477]
MNSRFPIRKILILAANPQSTSRLRLDEEVRGIQRSLQLSQERDRFALTSEWAVRTEDLMQLLVSHSPHIVHFLGHGTGEHGLVLEDGRGRSQLVPTRALSRLFQQVTSVECVLLNACYSDTQAQAISQFVSCVVGMNQPIGDPAAVCFARGFYTALGGSRSYEAAYEMGRTAIELEGIREGATPVLRTRAGRVVDDGLRPRSALGDRERGQDAGRVFISYRDEGVDKALAQTLYEAFVAAGYGAFMAAASIQLGEKWRDRIATELRQCDYFVLLLSPLSATSEMVTEEVKQARSLRDRRADGYPMILPIRVQFPLSDPLNYELRGYLQQIQQREWHSEADTAALIEELMTLMAERAASGERQQKKQEEQQEKQRENLSATQRDIWIEREDLQAAQLASEASVEPGVGLVESVDRPPLPVAEPELQREPGGAVQFKTGLYVARPPTETDCFAEIEQPGALIRIKAPRQMGKTSLMARILSHAREQGYQTVPISFQRADSRLFNDLDLLLKWFCSQVGRRLKKLSDLEDYWVGFGSKDKCNAYFEECLLEELDVPLVLALDEVDMVFPHPAVADDFFALVRSWYESARYGDFGSELWEKLRLVMVHSTEAYVPLNINQSPFNVGTNIELEEFDLAQVQDLAGRYELSAIASYAEALMALVGGHPYLIRKALYHLRREDMTLNALAEMAATESGIYSDHLRRHLYVLRDYPVLAESFRQVVSKSRPIEIDAEASFKLESMGLVRLSGNEASPRCEVYREYFRDHLEG